MGGEKEEGGAMSGKFHRRFLLCGQGSSEEGLYPAFT